MSLQIKQFSWLRLENCSLEMIWVGVMWWVVKIRHFTFLDPCKGVSNISVFSCFSRSIPSYPISVYFHCSPQDLTLGSDSPSSTFGRLAGSEGWWGCLNLGQRGGLCILKVASNHFLEMKPWNSWRPSHPNPSPSSICQIYSNKFSENMRGFFRCFNLFPGSFMNIFARILLNLSDTSLFSAMILPLWLGGSDEGASALYRC